MRRPRRLPVGADGAELFLEARFAQVVEAAVALELLPLHDQPVEEAGVAAVEVELLDFRVEEEHRGEEEGEGVLEDADERRRDDQPAEDEAEQGEEAGRRVALAPEVVVALLDGLAEFWP